MAMRQRWKAARGSVVWCGLLALFVLGCPTYEESFTGHYQEIGLDELSDEAIAVDLFRFGNDMRAVLRTYDIASATARETPFDSANQTHCRWTRVAGFDEATRQFSLTIPATVRDPRVELIGELDGNGTLSLLVQQEEDDEPQEVTLERSPRSPDAECSTIDDFFMRAIFDDVPNNGFPASSHTLRHPVFSLLWVSVEPVNRDGVPVYVALNDPEPAIRLSEGVHFDRGTNALMGNLSLSVPPPAERIRVSSGETRYALAHFVIIDDEEEQGGFSWNVDREPVVATALEKALPDDAPPQVNGWGKALLFVEGRVDQLDDELLILFEGIEEAELDRHFYIVDVFFINDQVVSLRLPARPEAERPVHRRVPLQATEDHLEAGEVPVPRLFHD